jgi:hypothetical protein
LNCPRCGKKTAEGSEKCTWCGLELVKTAPADVEPPIVTPDVPPTRVSEPRSVPAPPSDVVHDTPAVPPLAPPPAPAPLPPRISASAPPAPVFRQEVKSTRGPRTSAPMIGGAILVLLVAAAAYLMFGRKSDPVAATPDTTAVAAPDPAADSARAAAAQAAAMGYIRVSGDLPDDAVIWLDSTRQRGRVFTVTPGSYDIEIETEEFEAWERRVTVRAGDTTRVRVELELKSDSTTTP